MFLPVYPSRTGVPRLKEWAYAGLVFNYAGAALSHLAARDGVETLIGPIIFGILTVTSWSLRSAQTLKLTPLARVEALRRGRLLRAKGLSRLDAQAAAGRAKRGEHPTTIMTRPRRGTTRSRTIRASRRRSPRRAAARRHADHNAGRELQTAFVKMLRSSCRGSAPMAARMPISLRRCDTVNDIIA